MSLYDVTYDNFALELLPPDKRFSRTWAFLKVLISQVQYLRDIIVGTYKNGAAYGTWASGTSYALGARVIYKNSVFESNISGNTDTPPSSNWNLIQQLFIGVDEQVRYTGQKIVLEYALNRFFATTFRQPPSLSDIYLTPANNSVPVFVIGGTEANSSVVYSDHSTDYIVNNYSFNRLPNLNINIPVAVYNALDSLDTNRIAKISAFINQFLPAGITYIIVTY